METMRLSMLWYLLCHPSAQNCSEIPEDLQDVVMISRDKLRKTVDDEERSNIAPSIGSNDYILGLYESEVECDESAIAISGVYTTSTYQ